jgi:hypothetical protein
MIEILTVLITSSYNVKIYPTEFNRYHILITVFFDNFWT